MPNISGDEKICQPEDKAKKKNKLVNKEIDISIYKHFPAERVLAWYDKFGRDLPWRVRGPSRADAYHVFLSELMLQQTGVSTVIPYFMRFTERWPTIESLAQASEEDILAQWAGLGYYARARNMHKAAQHICDLHDGHFPEDQQTLLSLPGIGPYSAGAIAAIAFGKAAIVLDGNIERILVRYGALKKTVKQLKPDLAKAYALCLPDRRHSDFPQALMDIGAMICQPRRAVCSHCPLQSGCKSADQPFRMDLPIKETKVKKPHRKGRVFIIVNKKGECAMHRRPAKGLLGGMLSFPSYGWDKTPPFAFLSELEKQFDLQLLDTKVKHVFTHFSAEISVYAGQTSQISRLPADWVWQHCDTKSLSSLMAKCWHLYKSAA